MTHSATARAWCRADLAGGTLDIWPLGMLHPGARTINVAIGLAATAQVTARSEDEEQSGYRVRQGGHTVEAESLAELAEHPDGALVARLLEAIDSPPVEVELSSGSPRGAGLGASSALSVAMLAAVEALAGRSLGSAELSYHRVAALIRDVEARLMGLPTGIQDHYPGLLGGVLEIEYRPGEHRVRRLDVDLDRLGESLVIAYSGRSHFSAGSNWQVVRRRLDGDREIVERFEGIAAAAAAMPAALEAGDLPKVGALMQHEWEHRRRLAEGISTPEVEALLATAREHGAWGGKVTGAGGGGCVAVLAPPERRQEIVDALHSVGGQVLDAPPRAEPLWVEVE